MRRLLPVLLGASLLFGACGDDSDGDRERAAATSIPDDTTSSTTTTEPPVPPPDVIPSDPSLITEEYVEQVLNLLFERSNAALLTTMGAGLVDQSAVAQAEAVATDEHAAAMVNSLIDLASSGFQGIVSNPTGLRADVVSLHEVDERCVVAEVRLDATGVSGSEPSGPSGARSFAVLHAASAEEQMSDLNPTAWVIAGLPATVDGSEPVSTCGAD